MLFLIRPHVNHLLRNCDAFTIVLGTSSLLLIIYPFLADLAGYRKKFMKAFFSFAKSLPVIEGKVKEEKEKTMSHVRKLFEVKGERITEIPESGIPREQVLEKMQALRSIDVEKWTEGKLSGCIYLYDEDHTALLNAAYSMFSSSNPLHPDVFPAVKKFESEVISMTIKMLNGGDDIFGAMTSGGTESILMAVKAYREKYKSKTSHPEIIVPVSAHAAFDKACHYFGVKLVHIPLRPDTMAVDISQVRRAINKNTIAIVGSAPGFPHGVIDPIQRLSELAQEHHIGMHVDTCLGGFVLPFAEKLGYPIPVFDFRLPGVTSMSADTHKYGYTSKGTSVVMFRTRELRSHMYFVCEDWTGGAYASPTIAGSRPGGLIAAAWAGIVSIGKEGYMRYVDGIMKTSIVIIEGIKEIPELYVVGQPGAMVVAFGSDRLDVFKVNAAMNLKGWNLNALQFPSSVHICVTAKLIGMGETFVQDLRTSVEEVKANPEKFLGGTAAMYGMAATIPDRSIVSDIACGIIDAMLDL